MKRLICLLIAGLMPLLCTATTYAAWPSAPRVSTVTPGTTNSASPQLNVPVNTTITVTFDQDMRYSSIYDTGNNINRITLQNASNGANIPVTISPTSNATTYTLTLGSSLATGTTYKITIANQILQGARPCTNCNRLSLADGGQTGNLVYYFTTSGIAADTTPPIVTDTNPVPNQTGVPINPSITVTFSEDVRSSDVTSVNNIYLRSNASTTVIACNYVYDPVTTTVTLRPQSALTSNTQYRLYILRGIRDSATPPNSMVDDYPGSGSSYFRFTTATVDATPPTVSAYSPTSGQSGVDITTLIAMTFSENMDATTINSPATNITVSSSSGSIAGTIAYDASGTRRATFTPTANLAYGTTYTVTVTTGVRDLAGNAKASPSTTWSFTTKSAPATGATGTMANYCQTPPFAAVSSQVKPNVLLIVDNSGSMGSMAYAGSGNWDSSYDPAKNYYGYFDMDKMYKYNASGYFEVDNNTTTVKSQNWTGSNSAAGNFLNWLTMRRIDVVRKVLIGGKSSTHTDNTANYITALAGGDAQKQYSSKYYVVGTSNSNPAIWVCDATSNCGDGTATGIAKVYIGTHPPSDGLVQKMADRIRFGLMFFNSDGTAYEDGNTGDKDGGYIAAEVGTTIDGTTGIVQLIEGKNPASYTPLAESMYETVRYIEHANSAYDSNKNYATSADPIEYRCQKNFVVLLTDGVSTKDHNLPGSNWAKLSSGPAKVTDLYNFTDAKTWLDNIEHNELGTNLTTLPTHTHTYATTDLDMEGSYYLPAVTFYANVTDLRDSSSLGTGHANVGNGNWAGMQNISFYSVFVFDNSNYARTILKLASKYGGFIDGDGDKKPYTDSTCGTHDANSKSLANDKCKEWDADGNGIPDTYYEATEGDKIRSALEAAFINIIARVSSGTAASILNNSEGSGANLLQALFYPKKSFEDGTEVAWSGEIHNMWYNLEPFLQATSIREDSTHDYILNLKQDNIAQFNFNTATSVTSVNLFTDADGNGVADTPTAPLTSVAPSEVISLWQAGKLLWERNPTTRTIYTHTDISGRDNTTTNLTLFKKGDGSTTSLEADTGLHALTNVANITEAGIILDYTNGIDKGSAYRSREVVISNCGITDTTGLTDATKPCKRVWKLGDIISSTPKLASTNRLGSYSLMPPSGYNDSSYAAFLNSTTYKTRGMAFVGANDGMLHAFRLGVLKELTDRYSKAKLTTYNSSGTTEATRFPTATASSELGKEEWAFIPKQTLPYLKYLAESNYNHIFFVDKSPVLVDASVGGCNDSGGNPLEYSLCAKTSNGSTWRTILIGASGFGGAAKDSTDSCTSPANCVKTPITGIGYSTFFALDVTDPAQPKYLWEFYGNKNGSTTESDHIGELGFTLSGPAIIRVSSKINDVNGNATAKPDHTKNGKWFAVFASGPTGPIDTTNQEFRGGSDQPLKLFIVDLASGKLIKTILTGIDNAFGSSITTGSAVDTEAHSALANGYYSDNVLYIGYVKKDATAGTWTKGGVGRLVTHESTDPSTWTWSTVLDDTGPVTTTVTRTVDRKNKTMWLYFGTGRYYFKLDDDSASARQSMYGLKEPCYSTADRSVRTPYSNVSGGSLMTSANGPFDATCTDSVSGTIVDQSGTASTSPAASISATAPGWKINLDQNIAEDLSASPPVDGLLSERVITDPVASPSGAVFFTTFMPSSNACKSGGDSLIWAVRYDSGAEPPEAAMKGKVMLQSSTGSFTEVDLSSAFNSTNKRYNKRRISQAISGVPPTGQGLLLMTNPRPSKKMLQIMEK